MLEASATKLFFGPLRSYPYMLRDPWSPDKLLEDGAQQTCDELPLPSKEIVVESHGINVFRHSVIA